MWGDAPTREFHRRAGLPGVEGAEPLASPAVYYGGRLALGTVAWLKPALGTPSKLVGVTRFHTRNEHSPLDGHNRPAGQKNRARLAQGMRH